MERYPSIADDIRLYNLETSTTTNQRRGKVWVWRDTKIAKVAIGERGTWVTTCYIVSAIGQAIEPAMVFLRNKFRSYRAPSGMLSLAVTRWCWYFHRCHKPFYKACFRFQRIPSNFTDSIEAILGISSRVTFHPHIMAKLQLLDVGLNGPFKTYYSALTIYNVTECIFCTYLKAMAPANFINSLKNVGYFYSIIVVLQMLILCLA